MRKFIGKIISVVVFSVIFISTSYADEVHAHWGYQEGSFSADKWGDLAAEYQLCKTGKFQSPINIDHTVEAVKLPEIKFYYAVTNEEIVNNGHTIQISLKSPDDYIVMDGMLYYLQQFHFHTPSENQIKGKSYPLEVHFVHANKQGDIAVIAAMFEIGEFNEQLEKAWNLLTNEENKVINLHDPIDLYALLPKDKSYYRYSGSLTTPPCSEGVAWLVFKNPIMLSETQYQKIKSVINYNNNRPTQEKHGRIIIE